MSGRYLSPPNNCNYQLGYYLDDGYLCIMSEGHVPVMVSDLQHLDKVWQTKVLRAMAFDWIVGAAAVVVALSVQARFRLHR